MPIWNHSPAGLADLLAGFEPARECVGLGRESSTTRGVLYRQLRHIFQTHLGGGTSLPVCQGIVPLHARPNSGSFATKGRYD